MLIGALGSQHTNWLRYTTNRKIPNQLMLLICGRDLAEPGGRDTSPLSSAVSLIYRPQETNKLITMNSFSYDSFGVYGRFPRDVWGIIIGFLPLEDLRNLVLNSQLTKIIQFNIRQKLPPRCLADVDLLKVIGCGRFSKVFQVRVKKSKQIYALTKINVPKYSQVEFSRPSIRVVDRLMELKHPFLLPVLSHFCENEIEYVVTQYIHGGDLFYQLQKRKRVCIDEARFYAAEVLLVLEYLHNNGIVLSSASALVCTSRI